MNSKKNVNQGVKFKDELEEQEHLEVELGEDSQQQKRVSKQVKLKVKEQMIKVINESDSQFKQIISKDPHLKKKDSVVGVKQILDQMKAALTELNKTTFKEKMKNYYLCYNASIYIYQICRHLRASEYGQECITYLAFSITSLESYLILNEPKYLEWRV